MTKKDRKLEPEVERRMNQRLADEKRRKAEAAENRKAKRHLCPTDVGIVAECDECRSARKAKKNNET